MVAKTTKHRSKNYQNVASYEASVQCAK